MANCKKTITGKHLIMPETIFNEEHNWYVTFYKCIACGLVDDSECEVKKGEIKPKKPWGGKI